MAESKRRDDGRKADLGQQEAPTLPLRVTVVPQSGGARRQFDVADEHDLARALKCNVPPDGFEDVVSACRGRGLQVLFVHDADGYVVYKAPRPVPPVKRPAPRQPLIASRPMQQPVARPPVKRVSAPAPTPPPARVRRRVRPHLASLAAQAVRHGSKTAQFFAVISVTCLLVALLSRAGSNHASTQTTVVEPFSRSLYAKGASGTSMQTVNQDADSALPPGFGPPIVVGAGNTPAQDDEAVKSMFTTVPVLDPRDARLRP